MSNGRPVSSSRDFFSPFFEIFLLPQIDHFGKSSFPNSGALKTDISEGKFVNKNLTKLECLLLQKIGQQI